MTSYFSDFGRSAPPLDLLREVDVFGGIYQMRRGRAVPCLSEAEVASPVAPPLWSLLNLNLARPIIMTNHITCNASSGL